MRAFAEDHQMAEPMRDSSPALSDAQQKNVGWREEYPAELYPIPRTGFKVWLESVIPDAFATAALSRRGWLIAAEATRK
ncbi:MAG: hypothetical protein AB7U61_06575 [Methylocystis sp.]